jgi:hypothetical protein
MAVSDEELAEKRKRVEKLRSDIASAEATQAARVREQENEIEAAQLDAEAARLEAQLTRTKERSKVASIKDGASRPLDQAKEELKAANAQAAAAAKTDKE